MIPSALASSVAREIAKASSSLSRETTVRDSVRLIRLKERAKEPSSSPDAAGSSTP